MKNKWHIEPENDDMCNWACVYLFHKFGVLLPRKWSESDYEYCVRVINHQKEGNDRDNLLKSMQAAWRQKKYKQKQILKGKVPCSFLLHASTHRNLDRLATSFGETINVTLESIINGTYLSDKEYKKQLQAEKKQRKKTAPATPLPDYRQRINDVITKNAISAAQGDYD
ncbi:hypothetical protein [Cellvibrio sp. PSBB006]|uniref:hypothetical protein n=1 Tax=Cellvibrio sp. PSBB006 TaxID=1987723 RepID=UPI000B3B8F1B|nr:hypothetical protein [Cellvibrio sp. PSBB006]ARU26061.1 hypothetical protein CBR65_00665 [Cellvibrio sp. PSBB006]